MRIVTAGRLASFLVLEITCCFCRVESQTSSQQIAPPPAVVIRFVQKVGSEVSAEKFYNQAPESLWEVYPEGDALKSSLIDFIKRGEDGPGLGFAGLALIPFHDPATVRPILERAMSQRTSQATRWCFLNAAPYILGMGDVMYGGEGKLDKESKELSAELLKLADLAVKTGTGHMHALQLEQLLNAPASTKKEDDYGLAVWHESAYLLGTVDLKDEQLVSKALTSEYRTVFQNAIIALSFAANRDFLMELKKKRMDEVTPTMEQAVGRSAITWWQSYLGTHPDGDWNDSVMSGFHDAGYVIEQDKKSAQSQRELLRALNDQNPISL